MGHGPNILRALAGFLLLAVSLNSFAHADTQSAALEFSRIGIVPFRDDGNIRDGAAQLTEMLKSRLDARFDDVEFFIVDLEGTDFKGGPVLLKEAIKLCDRFDADALLDGVFIGIEIGGGTWPNKGSDRPLARGVARWRLVNGENGLLVTDGLIDPDKPTVYSTRIRSTKQLVRRVLQDMVLAIGDELEVCGALLGTDADEEGGS